MPQRNLLLAALSRDSVKRVEGDLQRVELNLKEVLQERQQEIEHVIGLSGDVIFTPEDQAAGAPQRERDDSRAKGRAVDERWHVRKNGSRFWGSGLLMPLADGSGFVKIMRDLTERRNAQEHLRRSEELFRLLATNIPQLVFRTHPSGERNWGSPQRIAFTGLSR